MPKIPINRLREFCENIYLKAGASEEEAKIVVDNLIQANLYGHDSHGVLRTIEYCNYIKNGVIKPKTEPKIVKENEFALIIDGRWGFGQVAVYKAMKKAISKAKKKSIGVATVFNCNHCGMLGYYTLMAAKEDMIGFAAANSVAMVAPYGSRERILGTNPLSIAIPSGRHKPFLLDFATSVVSGGVIELARARKEKIPLGWLLDDEGRPTTNPEDYEAHKKEKHGALLPFGGYKGSGICMAIEILGGALAGSGVSKTTTDNGVFLMALDVNFFRPIEEFKSEVDRLIDLVKKSKKAQGFTEVFYPGELEYRKEQSLKEEGSIFIDDDVWNKLIKLDEELSKSRK